MIELMLMIFGIVAVVGLAVGVRLLRWKWFWRDTMKIRKINRDGEEQQHEKGMK